jgi:hypothetical protein
MRTLYGKLELSIFSPFLFPHTPHHTIMTFCPITPLKQPLFTLLMAFMSLNLMEIFPFLGDLTAIFDTVNIFSSS